jgi:hypothetical protein
MKLVVRITTDTVNPGFVATQARRRKEGDLAIDIAGRGVTEKAAVADLARALVEAGVTGYRIRKPTVRKSKTPKEPPSA